MRIKLLFTASVFFLSPWCVAQAQIAQLGYQLEAGAKTYQANNAVSIDQFDADFAGYDPKHSQLFALGENSAYIQATRSNYTIQIYKHQEIFINAGRETGQLYADINAGRLPTTSTAYTVDFDGYGIEQTGLSLSRRFDFSVLESAQPITIAPALRIYNINRYREIQARGNALARADGSYDLAINTAERDTRADFVFPVGQSPSGSGYALDLSLQWQINPQFQLFLQARDLYSANQIKNTPITVQTLNSNVNQFDENGVLNYRPAIQGQNSRQDYDFSLPVKTHLGARLLTGLTNSNSLGLDIRHIQGLVLPRISVAWAFDNSWVKQTQFGYESHFESFDAAVDFKYGGVRVGFDTFDDEKRRVEFLQLYMRHSF